jgi:hypothetical protein
MPAKRSFSAADTPKKSEDYHGMAKYANTSPDVAANGIESINVHFTFEEALRLSLAVQTCLINLNKYDRSKGSAGRNVGLSLSIKTASKSVAVIETAV